METGNFGGFSGYVALRLEDRNRLAAQLISQYAGNHGLMDVGVGLVGLFPGAAIPALMTAIGLQGPVIYQPLARKLQAIYCAAPDELDNAIDDIVNPSLVINAGVDIAADFGAEFLLQIASELLVELGLGAALSFIPIIGAIAGAALDWEIATRMTNRVGRMVAIYFQNGQNWVISKEHTYQLSKETKELRDIRRLDSVKENMVKNVRIMVSMMRPAMTNDQIRESLQKQGVPDDIITEALK